MISVITWDAGFRESFHTVDCFRNQSIATDQFEFIWVDHYSNIDARLRQKIDQMPNAKAVCLEATGNWHLGRALNYAVNMSIGKILVIPDGDIIVETDFLEKVLTAHCGQTNLVLYFRRWDQPMPPSGTPDKEIDIDRLKAECRLTNTTNYGGCISVPRKTFLEVGGYEEHEVFSNAGAISMELYTRLKNLGAAIVWSPDVKIYHPWHVGSYPGSTDYLKKLAVQKEYIRQSDLLLHKRANNESVESIVNAIVRSDHKRTLKEQIISRLSKPFSR